MSDLFTLSLSMAILSAPKAAWLPYCFARSLSMRTQDLRPTRGWLSMYSRICSGASLRKPLLSQAPMFFESISREVL